MPPATSQRKQFKCVFHGIIWRGDAVKPNPSPILLDKSYKVPKPVMGKGANKVNKVFYCFSSDFH
nr:MAG TPA: hypothetical protein [Caudoviricetes sp.]